MNRIYALLIKEILAVWSDKKSRTILIIPPLIQLLIFAFAVTLDVKNVSMGILNRDGGERSIELTQRFHGSPIFSHITYLQSVEEIAPYIDNQRGLMVLSIDSQFSRQLDANKKTNVQLILDGRKSNTSQIVAGYAKTVINHYANEWGASQGVQVEPATLIPRYWFNPNLYFYWANIPSLVGILTMLVGLLVTALSVARERELGTFDQLLVSPLGPREILLGKAIPAVLIGIAEGSIILLVGIFFFGVPFQGHILFLYSSMLFFISSVVGIGLFISSLCSTQQQAILGTFVFMAPAVMLSGFATPIENMPQWLQYFTYANPLRYFIIISKGIFLKAMPMQDVWHYTWPLSIIAAFTLSGTSLFFRKRLQ